MAMDKGMEQAMQSVGEGVRAGEGRSTAEDRRETGGRRERLYGKDLTVEVEVEGSAEVSMMDILRGVAEQCGVVTGCRVRREKTYEITMDEEAGKRKLLDGLRIKGALVQAREINNLDMVVSFINLPVYVEDAVILARLQEWGVRPLSAIKRRKWPGTDIADGTRFLKVRFNEQVRSLPYSTKLETLRGAEYFRVIHDRQVQVCRLCVRPGHILRECPDFKCFRCQKRGHFARECMERGFLVREEEEERRGQPEEEAGGDDGVEGAEEENGGQDEDVEEELDRRYGSDSGDGGGKDDDVEMTEQGRKLEDDVVTKETEVNRRREEQQAVEEGELQRQVGGGEREGKETKEPGLAAKRKAEEDRSRRGRGKGPRSGM
ncbi:hypothetical protein D9C73_028576 [Collichthys lucidus]|uniref:CCHC-type domain-containing protein n=1 Tax=Collichthys lucidus TaxID=240159 RepID=A0A4U5TWR7_COLLU|nr:hypothetical protein D9C73_028576 [Collichthys lucidus]